MISVYLAEPRTSQKFSDNLSYNTGWRRGWQELTERTMHSANPAWFIPARAVRKLMFLQSNSYLKYKL